MAFDSAFAGPDGRSSFCAPPDAPARAYCAYDARRRVEDVDVEPWPKADGFSGADLKAVVDITVENKLREAIVRRAQSDSDRDLIAPLTGLNLAFACANDFATAKIRALFQRGGVCDDILTRPSLKGVWTRPRARLSVPRSAPGRINVNRSGVLKERILSPVLNEITLKRRMPPP